MHQIAFFSTAAEPQEAALIQAILATSRANNLRDDISGLLVAGGNRYLQVIEGPRLPPDDEATVVVAKRGVGRRAGTARQINADENGAAL